MPSTAGPWPTPPVWSCHPHPGQRCGKRPSKHPFRKKRVMTPWLCSQNQPLATVATAIKFGDTKHTREMEHSERLTSQLKINSFGRRDNSSVPLHVDLLVQHGCQKFSVVQAARTSTKRSTRTVMTAGVGLSQSPLQSMACSMSSKHQIQRCNAGVNKNGVTWCNLQYLTYRFLWSFSRIGPPKP